MAAYYKGGAVADDYEKALLSRGFFWLMGPLDECLDMIEGNKSMPTVLSHSRYSDLILETFKFMEKSNKYIVDNKFTEGAILIDILYLKMLIKEISMNLNHDAYKKHLVFMLDMAVALGMDNSPVKECSEGKTMIISFDSFKIILKMILKKYSIDVDKITK